MGKFERSLVAFENATWFYLIFENTETGNPTLKPTATFSGPPRSLFPELEQELRELHTTGVLPSQRIKELVSAGRIGRCAEAEPIQEYQFQPASIDLRLGPVAYRVRASFLPGTSSTVEAKLQELKMSEMDLTRLAVFEKGCVYVVCLQEELFLPWDISAKANPKSTTGRLDIFTRLITDYGAEFEKVPKGYKGKLYVEIVSRTFTVVLRAGARLNQIRFVRGSPLPLESEGRLGKVEQKDPLVYDDDNPAKATISRGIRISIDLEGSAPGRSDEIIGFRAKKHAPAVDLEEVNHYAPEDFWEPLWGAPRQKLILNPDDFHILVSKERVSVPPEFSAEMVAYDPSMGEFRIHYAGFFDPGFGYDPSNNVRGTHAVLEVRSHEVPFVLEHGQMVGRLIYERLTEVPDKIYGPSIGSSYQYQRLSLSKQFRSEWGLGKR